MAKTYRITIEYTTMEDDQISPADWDWWEILDLSPFNETFSFMVEPIDTNEDHVQEIIRENELE